MLGGSEVECPEFMANMLQIYLNTGNLKKKCFHRFLFWLSAGASSSIQRSDITGRIKTTLIKTDKDLKALTIDREGRRLFWLQFGLLGESTIASSDYRGHGLRVKEQPL